jgi:hypothetical protein
MILSFRNLFCTTPKDTLTHSWTSGVQMIRVRWIEGEARPIILELVHSTIADLAPSSHFAAPCPLGRTPLTRTPRCQSSMHPEGNVYLRPPPGLP